MLSLWFSILLTLTHMLPMLPCSVHFRTGCFSKMTSLIAHPKYNSKNFLMFSLNQKVIFPCALMELNIFRQIFPDNENNLFPSTSAANGPVAYTMMKLLHISLTSCFSNLSNLFSSCDVNHRQLCVYVPWQVLTLKSYHSNAPYILKFDIAHFTVRRVERLPSGSAKPPNRSLVKMYTTTGRWQCGPQAVWQYLETVFYGICKHVALMSVENEAKQSCIQISVFEDPQCSEPPKIILNCRPQKHHSVSSKNPPKPPSTIRVFNSLLEWLWKH